MARSRGIALGALLALLVGTGLQLSPAFAEGGDLDSSYGSGGSATTGVSNSVNRGLFTDSAGDAIVTLTGSYVQWDSNGGNLTVPTGNSGITFTADSTLDGSGRVIVIGDDANGKLRVARFANGALDTTFGGGNGWTALSLDFRSSRVAAAADGSLAVLAGGQIAKLTSAGALDPTWNAAGTAPGMTPEAAGGFSMAFQSSGDLVVVCGMDWSQNDPCLVRYNADGTPDATFGASGRGARPPIDSSHQLFYRTLAIAPDDTIYAGGVDETDGQPIVARLAGDGTLDPTWGIGGVTDESWKDATFQPVVTDLAVTSDGGVYAGTIISGRGSTTRTILKYNAAGARDAGIGANGTITVPDPNGGNAYDGLALQPDGALLVALSDPSTVRVSRYTTTGMAAPTAVSVTPTATGVHAQWTNPATASFDTAQVRRLAGTTPPSATTGIVGYSGAASAADIAVPGGSDESFAVLARDYAGNPSATVTVLMHGTRFSAIPTSTIRYGATKTLSSTLRRIDGTAVSGATVTVYGKRHGSTTWTKLGSATSSSAGAVGFALKPTVDEDVQLRFAGAHSDLHAELTTLVDVAPIISASWSHSSMPLGTTTRVSGTVSPNERGQVVYLQRYYSKAWHTVTHVTLSSASGYAFSVKPAARGAYYYRIYKPAGGFRAATSTKMYKISVT
jgi:uncharacterized delta-60 repeat protein